MAKRTAVKYQLAAQMYTLRDKCQTPRQCATTLKKVRKIGYRNIQVSGPLGKVDPVDLKKMCDDAGLAVIGNHNSMDDLRNNMGALIEKLHILGCKYTGIGSLPEAERKTLADYKRCAKEMTKHGKALAKEGIALQYHNHAFELMQYGRKQAKGGMTALDIIYKNSDPKYLQAEIDTFWIAKGMGDPAEWILKMKGRMDQVHFKDGVATGPMESDFCPIGEGNLNWPQILKACKAIRVKDYIVEQDGWPFTKNPFKALEISYNNLRKMGLK